MKTITIDSASADLAKVLDETANSGQPIRISGEQAACVLISNENWQSLKELDNLPLDSSVLKSHSESPEPNAVKSVW